MCVEFSVVRVLNVRHVSYAYYTYLLIDMLYCILYTYHINRMYSMIYMYDIYRYRWFGRKLGLPEMVTWMLRQYNKLVCIVYLYCTCILVVYHIECTCVFCICISIVLRGLAILYVYCLYTYLSWY